MTGLLDVLKEAALDTGFLNAFESSASRVSLPKADIDKRLLLCLYGLGTNAGIKRIAAAGDASYEELLHIRRRFIHPAALKDACAQVANATLTIRNKAIWGDIGTGCASDSTKFGAWDRNLMTEWHARYDDVSASVLATPIRRSVFGLSFERTVSGRGVTVLGVDYRIRLDRLTRFPA